MANELLLYDLSYGGTTDVLRFKQQLQQHLPSKLRCSLDSLAITMCKVMQSLK